MPLQSWALGFARLKYKTNEPKYVGVIIIFTLLCISISLFSICYTILTFFFLKKKLSYWRERERERPPPSLGNSQFCCCSVAKSCPILGDLIHCNPPGFSVHGISQAKYWSGFCFLLQGIFVTQGPNPHLLHWQADALPLNHRGSQFFRDS